MTIIHYYCKHRQQGDMPRFLIQIDSPCKRYKFRIVTINGNLIGYFDHCDSALAYCDSQ